MALTAAWALALIYALATPLGRRLEASGVWAVKALASEGAPGSRALQKRLMGGWPALLASDLWLLPLLGALILLFAWWWMVPVLLTAAFGLRWLLERVFPYPAGVEWYLERFRAEVQRTLEGADDRTRGELREIGEGLRDLTQRYAGRGCPPPTLDEARAAPWGDRDWLRHRAG